MEGVRGRKGAASNLKQKPPPASAAVFHLEDREAGLRERVEVAPRLGRVVELPAEDLHPQQGEDEDEQEEDDQQRVDRGDRVHQRLHQVAHRGPVPVHTLRGGVENGAPGIY